MKTKTKLFISLACFSAFVLWTLAVCTVDVRPIGPNDSTVGFASFNAAIHRLTGVHFTLYTITDWLGLVPIAVCAVFGVMGLVQWITRRRLADVDRDLPILGGFYLVVIVLYLLFETVVINHRPVLINGFLEVSYPSSTTLLTLCVMPTAILQVRSRLRRTAWRTVLVWGMAAFTAFMVIGRLVSGVHWVSDILGGALLSAALVMLYDAVCDKL